MSSLAATVDSVKNRSHRPFWWAGCLFVWLIVLALLPDPRPLAAPDWAVLTAQRVLGLSEPAARLASAMGMRVIGVGMIGVLLSAACRDLRLTVAAALLLLGTPILALLAKSVNFGSFPASPQLEFIVIVAYFGGLVGLMLRRSWIAVAAFCLLAAGLLVWGTATSIPDELDEAARATGQYILDNSDDIPSGDDGFIELTKRSLEFAHENSCGHDPVMPNQAAILAMGVILGEDKVAWVGGRQLEEDRKQCRASLRNRISARGRNDLSRHFWVSASLTVLADAKRSLTVGVTKELKDSTPGGSGFSFVDMAANKAGIRFAVLATRDEESASAMQERLVHVTAIDQIFPPIDELPEEIPDKDFQTFFGGLGGRETKRLFQLIDSRVARLEALR